MVLQSNRPDLAANLLLRGPVTMNVIFLVTGEMRNITDTAGLVSAAILKVDPLPRLSLPGLCDRVPRGNVEMLHSQLRLPPSLHSVKTPAFLPRLHLSNKRFTKR